MENQNVQYYEIGRKIFDSNKINYSLDHIYMENFSKVVKDESIRDALILDKEEYNKKYEDEKNKLLFDLSLLELTSEIIDKN